MLFVDVLLLVEMEVKMEMVDADEVGIGIGIENVFVAKVLEAKCRQEDVHAIFMKSLEIWNG